MLNKKNLHLHILSDGTGETAVSVLKAVLVQYKHENHVKIKRHPNIRTPEQMQAVFKKMESSPDKRCILIYTLIMPKNREYIKVLCKEHDITSIDLLNELIHTLDSSLDSKTKQAGILRLVDEDYFKRIEAMDFFLKHDDGKAIENLNNSDIVLVGVSRTSKTPLSLFLSNKGWKVANIPLVYDIPPPKELFEVDQKKIVALTITPDYLLKIRKNRLNKFGYDPAGGHYASKSTVYKEVEEMQNLFYKYKWPILNVTDRALEETAGEIVRIVSKRMKISIKII